MDFNSDLTNILIEVGTGIISGVFIGILLEIISFILIGPFLVLYFFLILITATGVTNHWEIFAFFYLPFLLIKIGFWLLLCLIFGSIDNLYNLGIIYTILAGLIGFCNLVYLTLYEISIYEIDWKFVQLGFDKKLPPPLFNRSFKCIYHLWILLSNFSEFYTNRGIMLLERSNSEKAINNFNQAIKNNSNTAKAYYYRGNAYSKQNNIQQAIKDYTKAIEINPDYAEAYENRGRYHLNNYLREETNLKKAIEDLEIATNLFQKKGQTNRAKIIQDFLKGMKPFRSD